MRYDFDCFSICQRRDLSTPVSTTYPPLPRDLSNINTASPSAPPAGRLKPKPYRTDCGSIPRRVAPRAVTFLHQSYHMVHASTATPAVTAARAGFVSVASSPAADAARRPARPLKRSRKDQAAEAAGLSVGAQAGVGLLRTSTRPTTISPSSSSARLYERSDTLNSRLDMPRSRFEGLLSIALLAGGGRITRSRRSRRGGKCWGRGRSAPRSGGARAGGAGAGS